MSTCHLYTDLAWLWPMWGDAGTEYAHYCQHVTGLIRQYAARPVATLLDIGCAGGKNVLNLSREFNVTGLDLSPAMLAQAKELNPACGDDSIRRACQMSSGVSPVRFAIRASMRGPTSSSSWKANTKSGQPDRSSVRWEPDWRFSRQPVRTRAARTRRAFAVGQVLTPPEM
jgi:hypothetical protein